MTYAHVYNAITTDFELEPVLEDYFAKYPNKYYLAYQIIYKIVGEHAPDEFSYLIIFTRNQDLREKTVSFYEFLKAYCVHENRTAATLGGDHILPALDGFAAYQILGKVKKRSRPSRT